MVAIGEQLVIWCLLDGKHGHQNQVLGLADRISAHHPCEVATIDVSTTMNRIATIFRRSATLSGSTAQPNLIVGAGHRTHLPLVVLRNRFSARSVVLMKPSIPFRWFDFCIVPDVHDLVEPPANVIETTGVLNRVVPNNGSRSRQGIILVGGPSAHYRWSAETVRKQIHSILTQSNEPWIIATSRRTPDSFPESIGPLAENVTLVRPEETTPGWLPQTLAATRTAWVTEDSVSMMYEALTSGASVGVIELKRNRDNRVTECTDSLVRRGDVTRWSEWVETGDLKQRQAGIWEADRCAQRILARLGRDFEMTESAAA